jgi:acyl-CoA synthetase (AMP-forming)/AMP-acid ligase II
MRTLGDLLQERASATPTRMPVQFVGSDGTRSGMDYAQLQYHARLVADTLLRRTDRCDRALLAYPSGPEFIAAFFGCLAARVIPVPVPPPLPGPMAERFQHICSDCKPGVLLTVGAWASLMPTGTPTLATDNLQTDSAVAGTLSSSESSPNDVAYLQYSSGTTGMPRGVMVTHDNVLANCAMHAAVFAPRSDTMNVGWMPHFHDFGLVIQILTPIYDDRTNIVLDPLIFIRDPLRWLCEIQDNKASFATMPSLACELLLQRIAPDIRAGLDLSALRGLGIGAEMLTEEQLLEFADGFAAAGLSVTALAPSYGLAEAVALVSTTTPGTRWRTAQVSRDALAEGTITPDPAGIALVGSGRPAPGMQIRIADPRTRAELAPGSVGEILIAGPNVSPGYWGRPDPGVSLGGTRYLPTGDLGVMVGGELFVLDRLADRIVVDGRQHYPFDVERTARGVDEHIRRCVAFGGEQGLVLLIEIDDRRAVEHTPGLADRVREAVARSHGVAAAEVRIVPKGWVPVTTSGKPRRRASRDHYLADRKRPPNDAISAAFQSGL